MLRVLVLCSITFALTWTHGPVGGGLAWDALNSIGFLAVGVFGALHVESLRPTPTAEPPIRDRLAMHSRLGYVALLLVLAHAVGLLILDPVLIEYLEPGAPAYMIAGWATIPLLGVMIWSALLPRRRRLHGTQLRFRSVHRTLGAILLALTCWHVIGAGFYLDHIAQQLALVALAAAWIVTPRPITAAIDRIPSRPNDRWTSVALLALVAIHTAARNLLT